MTSDIATRLVPLLVALQFAAFGWRVNREISVGDQGRKTWFPVPDVLNVLSMLSVVSCAVIVSLSLNQFPNVSRVALAVGYVLIAFHPISMAMHYRLCSKEGRSVYTKKGEDYPYLTCPEAVSVTVALFLAAIAGWYVGR